MHVPWPITAASDDGVHADGEWSEFGNSISLTV